MALPYDLYYNDPDCDFTLKANDGAAFGVHKLIVTHTSATLKNMILSASSSDNEVQLPLSSIVLDHVLQCIYQGLRPKGLPPRTIPWHDYIPFLEACMFLGVTIGIKEAKQQLKLLVSSMDMRQLVHLLVQFDSHNVEDETADMKQRVASSVFARADEAVQTSEASALPPVLAMKLREQVKDIALKWKFIQSWLQTQSNTNHNMDEQKIQDMVQGEEIPDSHILWLFKFVVCVSGCYHCC